MSELTDAGAVLEVLDPDAAKATLDVFEADRGREMMDGDERRRLRLLIEGGSKLSAIAVRGGALANWSAWTLAGEPGSYAGVLVEPDGSGLGMQATARLAVLSGDARASEVLLRAVEERCDQARAKTLTLWIRGQDQWAHPPVGYQASREIDVLGRAMDESLSAEVPKGCRIRSHEPAADKELIALLRAAFEGHPDPEWNARRLRRRRGDDGFVASDLLVAVNRAGRLAGLIWMREREAQVAEVHVLAVSPDHTRLGLGRALLRTGLEHVRGHSCADVLLWVERGNEAAQSLYRSEGFERRWGDASFVKKV